MLEGTTEYGVVGILCKDIVVRECLSMRCIIG